MRDVKAVGSKFYHVIVPRDGSLLLNDWDLWGPLIICTVLAIILQGHSHGECNLDVTGNFVTNFIVLELKFYQLLCNCDSSGR